MSNDEWCTPNEIFDPLDKIFRFTLDPCANKKNHKTYYYITKESDSLTYPWGTMNWVNPPYSKEKLGKFMEKAYMEHLKGNHSVCLVPASLTTKWFHEYAIKGRVYIRKGRISFIDPSTGEKKNGNRIDNVLIVFSDHNYDTELYDIGWLRL